MGLSVEIDELVLTGFGRMNTDLVVRAFERELTRLLHQRGVGPVAAELDLVTDLPALPRTTSPRRLGQALARSVHIGLTRGAP